MRIVRSIVFMIKCYLTLTGNGITQNPEANTILTMSVLPTDEIIQTIQRTAIILRAAAPDELHLCSRYSTILMYLCTEMKHRCKPNMQPPVPRSISNDYLDKTSNRSENVADNSARHFSVGGYQVSDTANVSSSPFINKGTNVRFGSTEYKQQETTNDEQQRPDTFTVDSALGVASINSAPPAPVPEPAPDTNPASAINTGPNSSGGYLSLIHI